MTNAEIQCYHLQINMVIFNTYEGKYLMANQDYRIETDSMGNIKVPSSKLWGAQTQRSIEYFSIGKELMPIEVIHALAIAKKAAAITNHHLGYLDNIKKDLIIAASDQILTGKYDDQFEILVNPLIWAQLSMFFIEYP